MNKNKITVLALCAVLFALSSSAEAQQQAKLPKIGFLRARLAGSGSSIDGLIQELRALGYVEGKNIVFEHRFADNKLDRLPALADELIRLKVDVLFAPSTVEALAAKNATRTIPVIFVSADPIGAGLVESLARPGRNLTGFTNITVELAGKRLELLKETVPKLSRVAVLWDPKNSSSTQQWKESQSPARELGLQLHAMEVSGAEKFEDAFSEAIKSGSVALSVLGGSFINSYFKRIADLATRNRLPAISPRRDFVESGGLMSYGADSAEPFRRVALMVDKILKGTKPADLPVEQPTKFELVINLKTAKQIGLTIPPTVLARANRVIK